MRGSCRTQSTKSSEEQVVLTLDGERIPYDHLVLATGARATPAYERAITFGEDVEEQALHGLLRDTEEGYVNASPSWCRTRPPGPCRCTSSR